MKKIPFQSSAVKSTVKGVLLGSAVALPLMAAAFPASAADRASDVEQLQSQLQELQSKVASLQAEQQAENTSSEKSSDDYFSLSKGGLTVGNTTFKLGGYVKLDAIYDLDNDMGDSAGNSQVLIGDTSGVDQGNFRMHARQTRLSITSTTSTGMGDIGGYVEGDFFGSGSSFRLRQAYLTWNNWLFGQAWSTFSDFNYGPTLDFYGPDGEIFSRHAQIRYTMNLSKGSNLAVALETPQDDGIMTSAAGANVGEHNQFPDAVARYQVNSGPLSFQAAAIARYIKADNVTGVTGDDGVFGWGGDLGVSYALPTGTTLMLTGTYGKGIVGYQYIYGLTSQNTPTGDAYVDDDGDLKATTAYTGVATISQKLSPTLTTNLIYGIGQVGSLSDASFANYGEAIKREDNAHINLIYTPVDHLMFGIEYIWVRTMLQNGDDGQANRIQFSTQYTF